MPESTSERWISVRVQPDLASDVAREACLAALFAVGAQGVHEDGMALVTHFPPATDLEAVHRALTEADEQVVIETAPVHLVLANIISSVLIELLPVIAMGLADNGTAILSGILREERDTMLQVLAAHGWRVLAEDAEEIWWSVSIARA